MAKVVVMVPTAIEEDVAHLELDTVLLVADTVHLTRGLGIVSTVNGVTSLRNARRCLVNVSGHN